MYIIYILRNWEREWGFTKDQERYQAKVLATEEVHIRVLPQ